MKAGAALGLLAGLGALNALGGGRNGTGKRFTGILDMLDGGGAGASGDKFEGGGLLSMLGNLFAKPLEAQDNVERIAADTNANKVVAEVVKQAITPEQRSSAAMTEVNRQRGLLGDRFDPRDQQGATDFRPPATASELTGSADMPPELLPMTTLTEGGYTRQLLRDDATPNSAFQQLFKRSLEEGYQGADMPSYIAEKNLIEMAKYPNSEYSNNMSEADYASLMPPTKEEFVMSQPLTQSPEAKGILAQPSAMTQSAGGLFADKGTFSAADAPKVQPDPMGLLEPNVPPQGALQMPTAPNVMLESPRSANEDMTMLQKLMGSVPEGLGPLNTDEYRDYVLGGGRLPYSEYEKTTPEYRATEALMKQYEGFQMMPMEEQMRLIAERADIIRREAPKPMPFTGPAF